VKPNWSKTRATGCLHSKLQVSRHKATTNDKERGIPTLTIWEKQRFLVSQPTTPDQLCTKGKCLRVQTTPASRPSESRGHTLFVSPPANPGSTGPRVASGRLLPPRTALPGRWRMCQRPPAHAHKSARVALLVNKLTHPGPGRPQPGSGQRSRARSKRVH